MHEYHLSSKESSIKTDFLYVPEQMQIFGRSRGVGGESCYENAQDLGSVRTFSRGSGEEEAP